jgi:CRISPR-associated exonuclease Cas4
VTGSELLVAFLLVAAGAGVAFASARVLAQRRRRRAVGELVAIDAGRPVVLRSERYHLTGRPDVLRQSRDGRLVPVEVKRRAAPARGPFRSHEVQLWSYCLLIEEATGRSPPYGLLRYSDREYRIPWDGSARAELLAVRRAALAPYGGEATPSPGRCRGCAWRPVCDVRAA